NVEVRQKRTYVKDGARAMTPDEERADILRKLEESRARNLAEQQALAEKDRLRVPWRRPLPHGHGRWLRRADDP
ncbi:hypothetical protein, partial [Klebsiella pneumoniae]|uniref:hypothetical protein n=1 Tax=Klebsiella pneumoniae TaxID=573 RepID=UPI0013D375F7